MNAKSKYMYYKLFYKFKDGSDAFQIFNYLEIFENLLPELKLFTLIDQNSRKTIIELNHNDRILVLNIFNLQ